MNRFDLENAKKNRRERIANRPPGPAPSEPVVSAFTEGTRMSCPLDEGDMVFTRGLTHMARVQSGLLAVANVAAFVCQRCGERSYDPPSLGAIQESTTRELAGMGVRAKLSKLARNNIGVYLPRDLQKHLEVEAGDTLVLQPVGRDFLLVQFERQAPRSASAARGKRRFVIATELFTTRADDVIFSGIEMAEGEAPAQAKIEGQAEGPRLKGRDQRKSNPTEIKTNEEVPADSPTAGMTLIYGGEQ